MGTKSYVAGAVAGLAFALAATNVTAATYNFMCISDNNAGNCATGEAQISVDVTQTDASLSTTVNFIFRNVGSVASSITDFYWDDATSVLLGITNIFSSPGTSISAGASPPNIPAPNGVTPSFSASFSADSNPPAAPNGINIGEFVNFSVLMAGGIAFSDVIAAMDSGKLRLGVHVQAFPNGGSESFVNGVVEPPAPVPLPAAGWLMIAGLGGLAALRRRKRA